MCSSIALVRASLAAPCARRPWPSMRHALSPLVAETLRCQGYCADSMGSFSVLERLLARRLELVARNPAGELIGIGDHDADREAEPRVVDHAVEVPVGADLVARL